MPKTPKTPKTCDRCSAVLQADESKAAGRCADCRMVDILEA